MSTKQDYGIGVLPLEVPVDEFDKITLTALQTVFNSLIKQKFAVRTSASSIASSTTLTADDSLIVSVDAHKKYIIDAFLYVGDDIDTVGLKIELDLPDNASDVTIYTMQAIGPDFGNIINKNGVFTETEVDSVFPTPSEFIVHVRAFVTVNQNAGNVTLKFAQNASSATPLLIKAGSAIRATRVN